ncbi:MAG TPA: surface-adhesin E family protein [Geobacteraceae bacterium]
MTTTKTCADVIRLGAPRFLAIVMLLGLLVAGRGSYAGNEPDWVLVDSDPSTSDFYYDKSAVNKTPQGILKVTTKVIYSEDGKADALHVLDAKKYANLAYTLFFYELDCSKRMSHLTRVVHTDDNGAKIAEFDLAGKSSWEEIPEDSRLEVILTEQCN